MESSLNRAIGGRNHRQRAGLRRIMGLVENQLAGNSERNVPRVRTNNIRRHPILVFFDSNRTQYSRPLQKMPKYVYATSYVLLFVRAKSNRGTRTKSWPAHRQPSPGCARIRGGTLTVSLCRPVSCVPEHIKFDLFFILAEIVVLDGGAILPAPVVPACTRTSARLKLV